MRILLDESLPRPLAQLLPEHDVRTVAEMGWAGKRNGELLHLAAADFDALLTADRSALPIAVVVLVAPTNRIESLRPLISSEPSRRWRLASWFTYERNAPGEGL